MSLVGISAPSPFGVCKEERLMPSTKTHERCLKGWHDDPDNSGMCIRCGVILDPEVGFTHNIETCVRMS